jgi:adenine/guanine phosphoribosyltransferase-like PRPP-binding protein
MGMTVSPEELAMLDDPTYIRVDVLRKIVDQTAKFLSDKDFDALAFSGNSGAILGSALSLALNKPMILVRKSVEDCHSSFTCEGFHAAKRYIIVDDFVSTGSTVHYISRKVREWAPDMELVGVMQAVKLYWGDPDFWADRWPWGIL